MKRVLAFAAGFCSLALTALPCFAQALPSNEQAADILEKARIRMQLAGPNAVPFHLFATVHYTVGKTSLDGTYEILWAAPDRYREEFRLGTMSATYLAIEDKLYVLRNTPTFTYPHRRVRDLVGVVQRGPANEVPVRVAKVYMDPGGAEGVACTELKGSGKHTECFDLKTGNLVSVRQLFSSGHADFTQDNFEAIGEARFPAHIVSTLADETLELRVEKLEPVPQFAEGVFQPPAQAIARDWCAQPVIGKDNGDPILGWIMADDLAHLRMPGNFQFHGYYADVAPDGHPERVARIFRDGSAAGIAPAALPQGRFPKHTCNGKPVAYETMAFALPVN